jgi:hypothetical protein
MSWLFSQALVEEYSAANYSDGEQSVQSNGSHTQQAYCAPDKMTDFSRLSRFGMMFKPLTAILGEELLMSYLAAFHVKTSAPLEKAQELMVNEAECGQKWLASFVKYDQVTSSWKTHQCSLLGDLDEFLETWPQWGLMRGGECWEQKTLEQITRGTGFGLSPNGVDSFHTPNTTGLDGGSNSRKALKKRQMLPTPTATTAKQGALSMSGLGKPLLHMAALMWPTPAATDYKGSGKTGKLRDRLDYAIERGATKSKIYGVPQQTGQLNPTWVEWLMGWPLGWTDLKPLEMDKSLYARQPHGEYSQKDN